MCYGSGNQADLHLTFLQVFDKYGIGTIVAIPTGNLIKDLDLKVSHGRI